MKDFFFSAAFIAGSVLFILVNHVQAQGVGPGSNDPDPYYHGGTSDERRREEARRKADRYKQNRDRGKAYADTYRDSPNDPYGGAAGGIGADPHDLDGLLGDDYDYEKYGGANSDRKSPDLDDDESGSVEEFRQVDTNGDGVMDAQEIRREHPEVTQPDLLQFFRDCDENEDGVISLKEYEEFLVKNA